MPVQIAGGGGGTTSANYAAVDANGNISVKVGSGANAASVDAQGALLVTTGGTSKTIIAAGAAGNTTIKNSAGRLCKIIVTATGTNPMTFTDGGTVVAGLPASPAIGTVLDVQIPCGTNIVAVGNAANPGVTVTWS